MKASLGDSGIKLSTVFARCMPFIGAMLAATALLIAFPGLVTVLL